MDEGLKKRWVVALRSGRYRQVIGSLREEVSTKRYGYCCLGVLCHVMGSKWKNGVPVLDGVFMEHPEAAFLSLEALRMADIVQPVQNLLAEKNDAGESFTEIADYIEANL